MTNKQIARLLRDMSAAYQVLHENRFKIIAYEKAADAIEDYPSEIRFLWQSGKLDSIPGIGTAIFGHLDELFRTGKITHFQTVMKKLPQGMFPLLAVPGLGPKRAYLLAKQFKLSPASAIDEIEKIAKKGKIAVMDGFGEKSQSDILKSVQAYKTGHLRKDQNRISILRADQIASEVTSYLKKISATKQIDILGSLRRRTATIGDLDIAVATDDPETVIKHFVAFPQKEKLIEQGPTGASIVVSGGTQVDLRVQTLSKYGAMLQYFTGSKNHNIQLREKALKRGLSLSEYGIKKAQTGTKEKIIECTTEEAFYHALQLPWIPPEMREARGEIEQAEKNKLPHLVTHGDIQGDVHIHSDYDIQSSHDRGVDSIEKLLQRADELQYAYIGLSDHNPKQSGLSNQQIIRILKNRKDHFEQQKYSSKKSRVKIILMLEIDILPTGELAIPDEGFEYLDAAIVSLHSSFSQSRVDTTKRILKALIHPKVKIFGHPTGRMIGKREGVQADWDAIFDFCAHHAKAIEINASPYRLDLPDVLIPQAKKAGVQFVINTDSHDAGYMDMMHYGVDVARRGWLESHDILNTRPYNEFAGWIMK